MLKIRALYVYVLLAVACEAYTTEVDLEALRKMEVGGVKLTQVVGLEDKLNLNVTQQPSSSVNLQEYNSSSNLEPKVEFSNATLVSDTIALRNSITSLKISDPSTNLTTSSDPTPSAKVSDDATVNPSEVEIQCEVGSECTGRVRKYILQPPDDLYEANPNPPTVTELVLNEPEKYLPAGLNVEENTKYILRTFTKKISTTNCTPAQNVKPNNETSQLKTHNLTQFSSAVPEVESHLTCDSNLQLNPSNFFLPDALKVVGIQNTTCSTQTYSTNDTGVINTHSALTEASTSRSDEASDGQPNQTSLDGAEPLKPLPKGAIIVDQDEDCPAGTVEYSLKDPNPITPVDQAYLNQAPIAQPKQTKELVDLHSDTETEVLDLSVEHKSGVTRGDMAPQFAPLDGQVEILSQPSPKRDGEPISGSDIRTPLAPIEHHKQPFSVPKLGIQVVDQDEPCPEGYKEDPNYLSVHGIKGQPGKVYPLDNEFTLLDCGSLTKQMTEDGLNQICAPRKELGTLRSYYPLDSEYQNLDCGRYVKRPTPDGKGLTCEVAVEAGELGKVYPPDTEYYTLNCGDYKKKVTGEGQECVTEQVNGVPGVYYSLDTEYSKLECGDYLKAEVEVDGKPVLHCTKHRKVLELDQKHQNLPHFEYVCPDGHHLLTTNDESYCVMEQVGEPDAKYPLNDFVEFKCGSDYVVIKEEHAQYCSAITLQPGLDEEVIPLPHQTVVCPIHSTLIEDGSAKVCKANVIKAEPKVKYTLLDHQSLECPTQHSPVNHETTISCEPDVIQAGPGDKVKPYPHQTVQCDEGYISTENDGYTTCVEKLIKLQPHEPHFPIPGQEIVCETGYHVTDDGGAKVCVEDGKIYDGSDFKLYPIELKDTLICPSKFPAEDIFNPTGTFLGKQCGGEPKEVHGNLNETHYLRPIDTLKCGLDQYVVNYKDGDGVEVQNCLAQTVVEGKLGEVYPIDPSVKVACESPTVLKVKGDHQVCTTESSEYLVVEEADCPEDTEFVAEYPAPTTDKSPIYGLPELAQPVDPSNQEFLCPYGYVPIEGEQLDHYLQANPDAN